MQKYMREGCSDPTGGWQHPHTPPSWVRSIFFLCSFLLDRVQKEQLAAIFKLMKDSKDTFGEMSDADVQEQLRLYDM